MKELFSIRTILVAGFVAVLAGSNMLYTAYTPYAEANTIGVGIRSFDDISGRFAAVAEKKGAVYAFEVLQRATLPPNIDLHLLGHRVGDILYAQKGVAGIADCTQNFRNACSHSIVIGTLGEFNASDEALRLIDEACHKAPGGTGAYTMCYHGLGHGVFAFFGYNLENTVAFCKKMGTQEYADEQYTQCVGGAIMELMGGGGHDTERWLAAREKYLPAKEPLAPCDSDIVPESARSFCYVYLTPRLMQLAGANLSHPDPATFPKAFSYCDAIPATQTRMRDACFGGFGKEFIPIAGARDIRRVDQLSNEVYRLGAQWCLHAAPTDGREACIKEELETIFWGGESDPRASFRFCTVVPGEFGEVCRNKLAEVIGKYLLGDVRKRWCNELPPDNQTVCADS